MVGRALMVHSNDGVWATFDEEIRAYKGPPVMAITEHSSVPSDSGVAVGMT